MEHQLAFSNILNTVSLIFSNLMRKRIITVSLIAAGVILIIVGIALKQPESVFAKAAKICMECVGIG